MVGSKKLNLSFTVNWLIAIAVAAVALILGFAFFPTARPTLVFAAAVIAGSGALLNAANGVDARGAQVRQANKIVALDFITRWTTPAFFYAKRNGREMIAYFRDHPGHEEQKAHLEEDPDRKANLFDLLNVFEQMGIAVETGIADEDILKRFFRSLLSEYWHTFEGFIRARRAERNNARLFQEAEALYNKWKG